MAVAAPEGFLRGRYQQTESGNKAEATPPDDPADVAVVRDKWGAGRVAPDLVAVTFHLRPRPQVPIDGEWMSSARAASCGPLWRKGQGRLATGAITISRFGVAGILRMLASGVIEEK
jgi:hypothetical protein